MLVHNVPEDTLVTERKVSHMPMLGRVTPSALERIVLVVEKLVELLCRESHQCCYLVRAPLEVFNGKRVHGHNFHSQFEAPLERLRRGK